MAKRFIDTGLFDDDWFMDLSKDAKILWMYFLTKCDHAGILKLNVKLCQLQTGIKDLDTVRQQLGNRLITVGEQLFFIPKFVEYQYPGFPNCKFQMAKSAIAILEKYDLIKDSQLTVSQELPNSYGNSNGNGNGKKGESEGKIELHELREKVFTDNVYQFSEKYPKEMLQKFILYWTEPNKSCTKMRWELEKVFDISRRLVTWASRDKDIVKTNTPKTYEEMLKMSETNPDIWKQYNAVKKEGERKAIFYPI